MSLIDADELIRCMDKRYNEKKDIVPNNLAEGFAQMERLIKEQPTAYDINEVIERLKEKSIPVLDEDEHVVPESNVQETYEIEMVALSDAIDIIQAGSKTNSGNNGNIAEYSVKEAAYNQAIDDFTNGVKEILEDNMIYNMDCIDTLAKQLRKD